MQDLTPVGLSKDGKHLVLVSDAGEEYRVRVDLRFRTALRGDNARLGQLEMKMESALRPRDIQARIRAGESAEDVAAAAQTTVDAIMAFAGPVLAERAHVAQTALTASIRRRSNDSSPVARTLDDASRQYLTSVSVRAEDVAWDAWRRDDGRWALVATYAVRGTEHRAVFAFDQPGRFVIAENDDAGLLTGESSPAGDEAPAARRLTPVGSDELPLGDDAIELVREPAPVAEPTPEVEPTADLSATVEAVREAVAEPADDLAADHADADWIAELPLEEPDDAEAPAGDSSADEQPPADEESSAAAPKKKGRSSVPSWDEIMFGGGSGRD